MSKLSDCLHGTIVSLEPDHKTLYRVYRHYTFAGGMLGTTMSFARLHRCELHNGHYWDRYAEKSIIREWSTECRIVDESKTAIAGEIFDTRS